MLYTPILATLGYVLSPDARQTLLVHRHKRAEDAHLGKYNGLGGKLLPNEDALLLVEHAKAREKTLHRYAVVKKSDRR